VTSAVACTEAWNWGQRRRLRPYGEVCVLQACGRTCLLTYLLSEGKVRVMFVKVVFGITFISV